MIMAIYNDKIDYRLEPLEVVWNRSRRSGKTEFATALAVFYALINMEVKWRSAYMRQQDEGKIWFSLNPFTAKIDNHYNRIHLRGNSFFPIDLGVLTPGNITGIECDCVFFDEGGWVFKGLQLYEAYKNARPMVAPSNFKHILHFSTPARSSAMQEAWDAVGSYGNEKGTILRVLRTWKDCPWITPEFIEYERRMNADCPWYIQQNYEGIFAVYGGAVFSNFYDLNDTLHVPQEIRDMWPRMKPSHGGVDWNGDFIKHYLGLYKITDDYIFALDELKFLDINFLTRYEEDVSLELEDEDPFSTPFANAAKSIGLKCSYFGWDEFNKMQRVAEVKRRTVIVDKEKCPTLWKNLQEAAFDEASRLPKLEKRTDQHGLDDMLHACHAGAGILTLRQKVRQKGPLFGHKSNIYNAGYDLR